VERRLSLANAGGSLFVSPDIRDCGPPAGYIGPVRRFTVQVFAILRTVALWTDADGRSMTTFTLRQHADDTTAEVFCSGDSKSRGPCFSGKDLPRGIDGPRPRRVAASGADFQQGRSPSNVSRFRWYCIRGSTVDPRSA
jgi:hypothetical protein